MSGSSGTNKKLECGRLSSTNANKNNLLSDDLREEWHISRKEQTISTDRARIKSENVGRYQTKRGENIAGIPDYVKNLETIRNKLKLLEITHSSAERFANIPSPYNSAKLTSLNLPIEPTLSSPIQHFPSFISPCISRDSLLTERLKKNEKFGLKSSVRSETSANEITNTQHSGESKTIHLCSPRKKMYFTSSSFSNDSSNSAIYSRIKTENLIRNLKNIKAKSVDNHSKPATLNTTTDSNSSSPKAQRIKALSKLPRNKKKPKMETTRKNESIVQVLNKVCGPKWEKSSFTSSISYRDSDSSSTKSNGSVDKRVMQNLFFLKKENESLEINKNLKKPTPVKNESHSKESSLHKCIQQQDVKSKPIASPNNVKKGLTSIPRQTQSNRSPKSFVSQKTRTDSFQKSKINPRGTNEKPQTHKQIDTSPENHLQSRRSKSIKSDSTNSQNKTERTSPQQKSICNKTKAKPTLYKFPHPQTEIPEAFNVTAFSKLKEENILDGNGNKLKVHDIHLNLAEDFAQKARLSGALIPHLSTRRNKSSSRDSKRSVSTESSSRNSLYVSKITPSPRSLSYRSVQRSFNAKSKKTIKAMFVNPSYSTPSSTQSETEVSSRIFSGSPPLKRICLREGEEYDIFEIYVDDNNSSIASTCTIPAKKPCIRDKTPEMTEFTEQNTDLDMEPPDVHPIYMPCGTPSERDSLESLKSDDFKNSILSMLLEWRQKEAQKSDENQDDDMNISKNTPKSTRDVNTSCTYVSNNSVIENEKFATESSGAEYRDDIDDPDFCDVRYDQQLSVISEETRVFSEDDVNSSQTNIRSVQSSVPPFLPCDLSLNLPLEPEIEILNPCEAVSSAWSFEDRSNQPGEKYSSTKDATTSVRSLKLQTFDKETYMSTRLENKDAEQQYDLPENISDKKLYTKNAFVKQTIIDDVLKEKSNLIYSCFFTPTVEMKVPEVSQVPHGDGDGNTVLNLFPNEETEIDGAHSSRTQSTLCLEEDKRTANSEAHLAQSTSQKMNLERDLEEEEVEEEVSKLSFQSCFTSSLDVPKKTMCLYEFSPLTKITCTVGGFDKDQFLTNIEDFLIKATTSEMMDQKRSSSYKKTFKDIVSVEELLSEKDDMLQEQAPKRDEDSESKLLTVLYKSKSSMVHSQPSSEMSWHVCKCTTANLQKELLDNGEPLKLEDEGDASKKGCFSCFCWVFGRRKRRFFIF